MNESEPSMKRRDVLNEVKTGSSSPPRDESGSCLISDPDGFRRTGGMNMIRALLRNVGTYPHVLEGKIQVRGTGEDESTDICGRGGVIRSSDEAMETWLSEGVTSHSRVKSVNYYAGGTE